MNEDLFTVMFYITDTGLIKSQTLSQDGEFSFAPSSWLKVPSIPLMCSSSDEGLDFANKETQEDSGKLQDVTSLVVPGEVQEEDREEDLEKPPELGAATGGDQWPNKEEEQQEGRGRERDWAAAAGTHPVRCVLQVAAVAGGARFPAHSTPRCVCKEKRLPHPHVSQKPWGSPGTLKTILRESLSRTRFKTASPFSKRVWSCCIFTAFSMFVRKVLNLGVLSEEGQVNPRMWNFVITKRDLSR
ncbi:hypothetical protein H920_18272 [Fukomys damarensis]|uniref:Uncharacterized protein n=1 Tax=Fukomys damarensis TaxID=885580 RepID=A0A091CQE3_FUKDA|nr:hypothetical protein H920_18272 [Fukomys damarensis]